MEYSPLSACIRMSLVTLSNVVSVLCLWQKAKLKFVEDFMMLNQIQELFRNVFLKDLG